MDPESLKYFSTLGVGGALAAMVFFFYRRDVALFTSQWRGQSEQLVTVVKENTEAITALREELRNRGHA